MPTPVIRGASRVASYVRLYSKAKWNDSWIPQPRAKVQTASRFLSPRVGECDILVYFGRVQPVGMSLDNYLPISIRGHFVKVTSEKRAGQQTTNDPQGSQENIDWVGYVVDDEIQPRSAVSFRGIQHIKAYTLEHLLDRTIINKALVDNGPGLIPFEIDWAPTFNLRDPLDRGERSINPLSKRLIGNANDDQTHFGRERAWSAQKVVGYLLHNYAPKSIPWSLTGQDDSLDQWIDVWPQEGLSIKQFIDSIVSRKSGYVWYIDTDGATYVDVQVNTIFGSSLTIGTIRIPENSKKVDYVIPSEIPQRHIFGSPSFRYTDTSRYDKVIVQSNRLKVVGTWSLRDGTLVKGWLQDVENAYTNLVINTPDGEPDVHAIDGYRAKAEQWKRVFTDFVVPREGPAGWSGFLGNGLGGAFQNAIPTPDDIGEISFQIPGAKYLTGATFEKTLPFFLGMDYSFGPNSPRFDQRVPGTDPDYRRPMVLFQDPYDSRYMAAEYMGLKGPQFHSASVAVLQKELGIEVRCSPSHHIAAASNDESVPADRRGPLFPNTQNSNQVDYRTMIATLMLELDCRARIVIEAVPERKSQQNLTLVITVKSAEYWYALANTVIDITLAGEPLTIHRDHAVPQSLRKDKETLEAVAALVTEWFAYQRQAIRLPVNDVGYGGTITPELGDFIKDVKGLVISEPVNAVCSGITFDYRNGTSLIETSFMSLDERLDLADTTFKLDRLTIDLDSVQR